VATVSGWPLHVARSEPVKLVAAISREVTRMVTGQACCPVGPEINSEVPLGVMLLHNESGSI
jgi:hypothetical protein